MSKTERILKVLGLITSGLAGVATIYAGDPVTGGGIIAAAISSGGVMFGGAKQ